MQNQNVYDKSLKFHKKKSNIEELIANRHKIPKESKQRLQEGYWMQQQPLGKWYELI